jgi:hypothetical protein
MEYKHRNHDFLVSHKGREVAHINRITAGGRHVRAVGRQPVMDRNLMIADQDFICHRPNNVRHLIGIWIGPIRSGICMDLSPLPRITFFGSFVSICKGRSKIAADGGGKPRHPGRTYPMTPGVSRAVYSHFQSVPVFGVGGTFYILKGVPIGNQPSRACVWIPGAGS